MPDAPKTHKPPTFAPPTSLRTPSSSTRLYGTAAWQRLRKFKLARDYFCECSTCKKFNKNTPATVVDHIVPHRGDPTLFYDLANLQSMAKSCHDRKTARMDGGYGNKRKEG